MYTTQKLTKKQKTAINEVVKKYIPGWASRHALDIVASTSGILPATIAAAAFTSDLLLMGGAFSLLTAGFGILPLTLKRGTGRNQSLQWIKASEVVYATLLRMEKKLSDSFAAVAQEQTVDREKRQAEFEALRAEITADRDVLSPVYKVVENPENLTTDKYVFCLEEPGEHTVEGTNAKITHEGVFDTLEPDQPVPVHSKPKRALKLGK